VTSGAAGEDITVSNAGGSVIVSSNEDVEDAITLSASTGGINITADGAATKDVDIVNTNGSINLNAGEAAADGIVLTATGGIDVVAANDIDFALTSGSAGEDFTITQTGGLDASIIFTTDGVGTDALALQATAGTLDVDADIGTVNTTGDLTITTTSSGAGEDLTIAQSGANDSSIIVSAAGTGADAISLQSTAGTLNVDADAILVDATADLDIEVTSSGAGEDLLIKQTGAQDASVTISAAGTGTDAIGLAATAGGITVDATGVIAITSTNNAATTVDIEANGGILETVRLYSNQGTDPGSITLLSDEGGITLDAGGDDDILLSSSLDVNSTIVGDGSSALSGMLRTVTNDADGDTLLIAEADIIETNSGAGGGTIIVLPEASTAIGMQFTIVTITAQNNDVNPDNADIIVGLTDVAGDAIRNATVGNTVTLAAVSASQWVVIGNYGTWTDVN
jgi:hypothetical protein